MILNRSKRKPRKSEIQKKIMPLEIRVLGINAKNNGRNASGLFQRKMKKRQLRVPEEESNIPKEEKKCIRAHLFYFLLVDITNSN